MHLLLVASVVFILKFLFQLADPQVYLLFLVVDQLFFDFKNIWDTTIKGREVCWITLMMMKLKREPAVRHLGREKEW